MLALALLGLLLPLIDARQRALPDIAPYTDGDTPKQPLVNFQVKEPTLLSSRRPNLTLPLLNHTFGNSWGKPAIVDYVAPSKQDWSTIVLEVKVTSDGTQYDRLASLYLHHVEILRTSTAEPTLNGIVWNV
jgi:hypothetical protein